MKMVYKIIYKMCICVLCICVYNPTPLLSEPPLPHSLTKYPITYKSGIYKPETHNIQGSYADALECLRITGADAVMSSEALLENPKLFSKSGDEVIHSIVYTTYY
jgi:hypothetical protein